MKKLLCILIIILVILSNYNILKAAPFDTGMITLEQPNSVTFTGRIWGDEFIYWMETENGYRFVQTFDRWYYYAALNQNGEYTATTYKVGIDSPPSSSYKLERSQIRINQINEEVEQFNEQIELNSQWYTQMQEEADAHEKPVTIKIGIILIEFTDTTHYKTNPQGNRPNGYFTADFDSLMFSQNYWIEPPSNNKHPEGEEIFGSFRDYWHQMSKGKLVIKGRVANPTDVNGVPKWLKADSTKGFYYNLQEWDSLANEAIKKALDSGYVDTTNVNAPNYFDNLVIIYAGIVTWGGSLKVNAQRVGGKYIFLAERSSLKLHHSSNWSFTHIGVYAHEFGHNIGFYDEYTGGYEYTDIHKFCLMGWGIYNGPNEKGECPATLSAYYRIKKNWIGSITITEDENDFLVEYNYANPNIYRINPVYASNDEHYLFETKKREGFDLYIPGSPADTINQAGRLLVWHCNIDSHPFNDRMIV